MPNKNRRHGRRSNRSSRSDSPSIHERVEVISGSQTIQVLTASGTGTTSVYPSSFTRALAIGDNFNLYRFTRIEVEFLPDVATPVGFAAGYVPGILDTTPSSTAQVMNLEPARYAFPAQTIPARLKIGRKQLVRDGATQWWKTIPGTPDAWLEIQGNIYWAANASTTVIAVFYYTVEFTGWVAATNTPKLRLQPSIRGVQEQLPSKDGGGAQSKDCASGVCVLSPQSVSLDQDSKSAPRPVHSDVCSCCHSVSRY